MKLSKPSKPFWEMATAELQEATREFDQEITVPSSRPMTPQERAAWERLKKRTKRSWRKLTIRLTPEMLRHIDVLAKRWKFSRSKVVRTGLESFLMKWVESQRNGKKGLP